uniref:Uncharacterized protein n=1 Tax=Candidatus Kentrum sp. MB TaxID=2138164 RepID=A0A450XW23_9GAMM|nr:MAG: hypothetical protein BECKMB1821I_GA0114274_104613 [Candidatus Kentron sp. MB]VFK76232.1 MAG: hypothetical protein BECKMB1821H_GA0114242_104713 [Candidatus Kentron sp. MB]
MLKKITAPSPRFGMTEICHLEQSGKPGSLSFSGRMEFLFINVNQFISHLALQMSPVFTTL